MCHAESNGKIIAEGNYFVPGDTRWTAASRA
jgi:hypothetical protein